MLHKHTHPQRKTATMGKNKPMHALSVIYFPGLYIKSKKKKKMFYYRIFFLWNVFVVIVPLLLLSGETSKVIELKRNSFKSAKRKDIKGTYNK